MFNAVQRRRVPQSNALVDGTEVIAQPPPGIWNFGWPLKVHEHVNAWSEPDCFWISQRERARGQAAEVVSLLGLERSSCGSAAI